MKGLSRRDAEPLSRFLYRPFYLNEGIIITMENDYIIRNTKSIFKLIIFCNILNFFISIIVARCMEPSHKGLVNLFFESCLLIMTVSSLGLGTASIYFLGKSKHNLSLVHFNMLILSLSVGLILAIILLYFRGLLNRLLLSNANPKYLILLAILGPFLIYAKCWQGMMFGTNQALISYRVDAIFAILSLIFAWVILALLKGKADHIIFAWSSVTILSVVTMFFILLHQSPYLNLRSFSPTLLSQVTKYGIKSHLGEVAHFLHLRLGLFMLGYFVGLRNVGLYALSVNIAEKFWLLAFAIRAASIFKITSAKKEDSVNLVSGLIKYVSLAYLCFGILAFILIDWFIKIIFGGLYSEAALPFKFLLPGVLSMGLTFLLSDFISLQKAKPMLISAVAVAGLMVNLALNLILIPRLKMVGAALSATISYSLIFVVSLFIFIKESGMSVKDLFLNKAKAQYDLAQIFSKTDILKYQTDIK